MEEELESKILEIYYKLNLDKLLKKKPKYGKIARFPEKSLAHYCWEVNGDELLILMEGGEEDRDYEIETVVKHMIGTSVCMSTRNKSLRFVWVVFLVNILFMIGIGVLVNSVWEGNSLAESVGVGIAVLSYFLYIWFYHNWKKHKRAQIRGYLDKIQLIYSNSDYKTFYLTFSMKFMFLWIFLWFEAFLQFMLLLTVIY